MNRSERIGVCIAGALVSLAPATAAELVPCFTPGQDCTSFMVREIDSAQSELLVQGYTFTSAPIIQAIARAKERGVEVKVILDRVNERKRYTGATYLVNHGIAPLIDDRVTIAHNKVMVIDGRDVLTGSFNFTKAAQERNAENVLVIKDNPALAAVYSANWARRAAAARPFRDFHEGRRATGAGHEY
jgi:phosphatidylserine/phosphatidylglycerophosphate/cardiolipin synthase-like enzyme